MPRVMTSAAHDLCDVVDRPGWARALPHERCNYHGHKPAVASYVGTPLCRICTERMLHNGQHRPGDRERR